MKNNISKLEGLKQKQAQLKAQIQKLEAAEKTHERKCEKRRQILVGTYYLDQARANNSYNELVKLMDAYLKRNSDRALFNLQSITDQEEEPDMA